MDSPLDRTPQAATDIEDLAEYVRRKAGLALALRFTRNAEAAIALLTTNPRIGQVLELPDAELPEMRRWQIDGFDDHLIIYRETERGIEIVRVLHGARDIVAILVKPS